MRRAGTAHRGRVLSALLRDGVAGIVGQCRAELKRAASGMASNSKIKSLVRESPTEPFKRAVTGCLRAIARKPELDISFAAERPGIVAGKARLPEPPRKLSGGEAAIVRGHADSIALKLACHDPRV